MWLASVDSKSNGVVEQWLCFARVKPSFVVSFVIQQDGLAAWEWGRFGGLSDLVTLGCSGWAAWPDSGQERNQGDMGDVSIINSAIHFTSKPAGDSAALMSSRLTQGLPVHFPLRAWFNEAFFSPEAASFGVFLLQSSDSRQAWVFPTLGLLSPATPLIAAVMLPPRPLEDTVLRGRDHWARLTSGWGTLFSSILNPFH